MCSWHLYVVLNTLPSNLSYQTYILWTGYLLCSWFMKAVIYQFQGAREYPKLLQRRIVTPEILLSSQDNLEICLPLLSPCLASHWRGFGVGIILFSGFFSCILFLVVFGNGVWLLPSPLFVFGIKAILLERRGRDICWCNLLCQLDLFVWFPATFSEGHKPNMWSHHISVGTSC